MSLKSRVLLSTSAVLCLFSFPLSAMTGEDQEDSSASSASTSVLASSRKPKGSSGSTTAAPRLGSKEERKEERKATAPSSSAPAATTSQRSSSETTSGRTEGSDLDFRLGKFKLGFEFQEASGLCQWALSDFRVQKKPLFSFVETNTKRILWDVVIDTSDIEFVTVPFTHEERQPLVKCLRTILMSCRVLQDLFKTQKGETSFKIWTDKLEDLSKDFVCTVAYSEDFNFIKNRSLAHSSSIWEPRFSPQATIQHRLECAIPLYFGLFGFNSPYMLNFSPSLPSRERFLDAHKAADFEVLKKVIAGCHQKINGLVFLHALTIVQMATNPAYTDADLLKTTYENLTKSHQVDAKGKLTIMSRRPFSSMFRDINKSKKVYSDHFKEVIMGHLRNYQFFKQDIPSQFNRTNYAEQFFNPATGAEQPLLGFLPFFDEAFLKENGPMVKRLLHRGVISTTMIRNFKKDVLVYDGHTGKKTPHRIAQLFDNNNFFSAAIMSVDRPQRTFIINADENQVRMIPWNYDLLSPPCFLEEDNSMGRMKEEMREDERQYGEAIIEVRGVRNVQPWFLKRCGLYQDQVGRFLEDPHPDYKEQVLNYLHEEFSLNHNAIKNAIRDYMTTPWEDEALGLFDFLNNFGVRPDDFFEIYYVGIPNGLQY